MSVGSAVFWVWLVFFTKFLEMEFENRFRFRLVFLAVTLICLSTITIPFLPAFVKSGSLHFDTADLASIFHVPPLKFFPIIGLSAVLVSFVSAYSNTRRLKHRILTTVDGIEKFRLESEAKRPFLTKHPVTGKTNMYQVQALLKFQDREHFTYLLKFKQPLIEIAKESARQGLGAEKALATELFGIRNISSIERRLLIFADQIGLFREMTSWHAAKIALPLVALPTIIWFIGNLAAYIKS